MCCDLLHLVDFGNPDPQHPLGGPDGGKDILVTRNDNRWVVACYFPTTHKTFRDVYSKFEADSNGALRNAGAGIAFFTNQHLTGGERDALSQSAKDAGLECDIFHLERLRALLDSARGCAVRRRYLGIALNEEETIAFQLEWQKEQESMLRSLGQTIERASSLAMTLTQPPATASGSSRSLIYEPQATHTEVLSETCTLSEVLNPSVLMSLHILSRRHSNRFEPDIWGRLRTTQVWIGGSDASLSDAIYVPPAADLVPDLLSGLLARFRKRLPLIRNNPDQCFNEIVRLHHGILSIHPFVNGNGSVAQSLLDIQAHELLGKYVDPERADRARHNIAIAEAHLGRFDPLNQYTATLLSSPRRFEDVADS